MSAEIINDIRDILKYVKTFPESAKKLNIRRSDFLLPGLNEDLACDLGSIAEVILENPSITADGLRRELNDTLAGEYINNACDGASQRAENDIKNILTDWRLSRLNHQYDTSTESKAEALQTYLDGINELKALNSAEVDLVRGAIVDADSFLRLNIPTPPELLEGILYQGDKMIINASSKIGKTWFLIRLGLAVSEGIPWLGKKTAKTGVLFVNFELKRHVMQKRIKKIKDDILPNVDVKNLHVLNVREMDLDAGSVVKILADLKDVIQAKGIGMIILDPIYKAYDQDTDENSTGDIANLLKGLERIATITNAAVVFSHHFAKGSQGGKFSIDRASGSGVYARDPDTIVAITALDDGDENCSYVVDLITRAFKQVPSFGIKIRDGKVFLDKTLDLKRIKTPNGKFTTKYNKEQILEILAEKPMTQAELRKEALERYEMSSGSFATYFAEVRKVEGVSENVDKQWTYTKAE